MFGFKRSLPPPKTDEGYQRRFILFSYAYLRIEARYSVSVNLGDYIQTYSVRNFLDKYYQDAEILFYDRDHLSTYNGLTSIVVMQGWFSHGYMFFPSNKLIPVYVGMHLTPDSYCDFLNFVSINPNFFEGKVIGCRDRRTQRFLSHLNIKNYLSRCLTLTLPKRGLNSKADCVYIVDVPKRLYRYIPRKFLEKAKFVTQRSVDVGLEKYQYFNKSEKYLSESEKILNEYAENAGLVITTALHCASPCTAMGVPVILIDLEKDNSRFDFLEDIIPIYRLCDLQTNKVNWNPIAPDIEELKSDMFDNLYQSIAEALGNKVDEINLSETRRRISSFRSNSLLSIENF